MSEWFDADVMEVLCRPSAWTWAVMEPPVDDARHAAWYAEHRDEHSQIEVLVAVDGETVYGVGDQLYPVVPGSVICFPSMVPHQLNYPPWLAPVKHVWFSVVAERSTCRVLNWGDGRLRSSSTVLVELPPDLPGRFGTAGVDDGPTVNLRRTSAVADLVATVIEAGGSPAVGYDRAAPVIYTILEHLRATAGHGDSIASLATIAGYSPYHFQRLFKRVVGCTVQVYIDHCRVTRVRALLAEGLSQKAIALELGFSSPQSFSRWLRNHPVAD